ncbi:MAG: peptidase [Ectothiorhodospiraceae bacterium]|nr:peptidase [Ectothiorhodospiraceae bacterium]
MKKSGSKNSNRRSLVGVAGGATTVLIVFVLVSGFTRTGDDTLYKVGKGIDLFGSIYKELIFNYVDEIDPLELMNAGIEGMLTSLDPYTVYIDEQDKSDVDILTTGQYGGLGISVRKRNNRLIITDLLGGHPPNTRKLHIGDEIIEVDGVDVVSDPTIDIKGLLRGKPGTKVSVRVSRPGVDNPLSLEVTRRAVLLSNVSYSKVLNDSIGYIKLDRFSRRAGEDMREAIHELQKRAPLKALIVDVRNNPGGLLDASVDVSEKFLPSGSLIVSTKGRKDRFEKRFYGQEAPLVPDLPLVVLVNGRSASASEIFAGAIQDYDRGLIVGTSTYGKGLVQNIIPLSYNSSLKITTSKYYTPSGRCIQKTSRLARNGKVLKIDEAIDTTRVFPTLRLHRDMKDAGGIEPDFLQKVHEYNKFVESLKDEGYIFDFVTLSVNTGIQTDLSFDEPKIRSRFLTFIDSSLADSSNVLNRSFASLLEEAKDHGYSSTDLTSIESIRDRMNMRTRSRAEDHWGDIFHELQVEFAKQLEGQEMQLEMALPFDKQVLTAISLLQNEDRYIAGFSGDED